MRDFLEWMVEWGFPLGVLVSAVGLLLSAADGVRRWLYRRQARRLDEAFVRSGWSLQARVAQRLREAGYRRSDFEDAERYPGYDWSGRRRRR